MDTSKLEYTVTQLQAATRLMNTAYSALEDQLDQPRPEIHRKILMAVYDELALNITINTSLVKQLSKVVNNE